MAGFLYLGAGLCMLLIYLFRIIFKKNIEKEQKISKKDIPYVILMVLLDKAAPILMMFGLERTTAANASLLNNFEIVMTSLIALIIFKEKISKRLWLGIVAITLSCLILSYESIEALEFSMGSLLILLAAICWGFENNCTKKISASDPLETVLIKGLCSGTGSIIIGLCIGERIELVNIGYVFAALGIGVVAYGLSIFFYIYAQRFIGAAKTSAYYAINPFVAVILSLLLFMELPNWQYWVALIIMILGAWLASSDKPLIKKDQRKIE
jgi:drug/metabolite transporter (DMT)-like permease